MDWAGEATLVGPNTRCHSEAGTYTYVIQVDKQVPGMAAPICNSASDSRCEQENLLLRRCTAMHDMPEMHVRTEE